MTYRNTFLYAPDEPQSVAEAIAANPQPTVDAPEVVETETVDAPEVVETVETEPVETVETEPVETEAPADPYERWGGETEIEAAHRMYEASKTEDGVIQLFLEAGKQLGLGLDRIETLFAPASDGAEEEEDDPDRVVTAADFAEFQKSLESREASKAQEAAVQQAHAVVEKSIKDLGIEFGDETSDAILRLGDKYLQRGDTNPANIQEAIRRGHADYSALIEKSRQEYVAKKEKAATVPSSPAGSGAPAEGPEPEPQNTAEAAKRVRELLRR